MKTDLVRSAVARLAVTMRPDRANSAAEIADARNAVLAARLERAIGEALQPDQPGYEPLRVKDRKRLAALLREGM